jgi:hypothetical protein
VRAACAAAQDFQDAVSVNYQAQVDSAAPLNRDGSRTLAADLAGEQIPALQRDQRNAMNALRAANNRSGDDAMQRAAADIVRGQLADGLRKMIAACRSHGLPLRIDPIVRRDLLS